MSNPYKKEEPLIVHNVRQVLGCLPILGSVAVGLSGLIGFGMGLNHANRPDQSGWLIGAGVCLLGSAVGFAVLAWVVWTNRRE